MLPVSTLLPSNLTSAGSLTAPAGQALELPPPGAAAAVSNSSTGLGISVGHFSAMHPQDIAAGSESLPIVWLQSGCEEAHLLVWHHGPLLLLLLLESSGPVVSNTAAVTASLVELMARPGAALHAQLAAELPPKHLWHVQGLRYLYQDHLAAAVRYDVAFESNMLLTNLTCHRQLQTGSHWCRWDTCSLGIV